MEYLSVKVFGEHFSEILLPAQTVNPFSETYTLTSVPFFDLQ